MDPAELLNVFTEFRREIFLMSKIRHACVVNLLAFSLSPLTIVMELAPNGNLYKYVPTNENTTHKHINNITNQQHKLKMSFILFFLFIFSFSYLHSQQPGWSLRCRIAYDIAHGMRTLHAFNPPLLHRDLKVRRKQQK